MPLFLSNKYFLKQRGLRKGGVEGTQVVTKLQENAALKFTWAPHLLARPPPIVPVVAHDVDENQGQPTEQCPTLRFLVPLTDCHNDLKPQQLFAVQHIVANL